MKRNAFTWIEMGVVLFILVVVAAIMLPVINRGSGSQRSSCQSNLSKIALAVGHYMQDSDNKFPPVNAGRVGWSQLLYPYIKYTWLFQCTSEVKPEQAGTTDYFYNSRLAGAPEQKLAFPSTTIMNGDGTGNAPSNANLSQFPPSWASESKSPAYRHLEGSNYSYADGHVRWLKAKSWSNERASSSENTFAPW